MNQAILEHIVRKAMVALDGDFGLLSTGEQLAVALVLNRPDWLAETGYSMVEAYVRLGPEWVACLEEAENVLRK